ncbi:MAG: ATP-binding protein, partial [Rubrivivax sp.]|nr:ATP-binding protein [Rubrivivax sp.]
TRLEAAQSQLMQSEKLASIGQLAAGVAHEINNPIGFVASNLHSLQRYVAGLLAVVAAYEATEPLLPAASPERALLAQARADADLDYLKEDMPELLAQTHDGLQRVKKIVQDLKDFSHADTGHQWEATDLEACLESTLTIANNEIKYKAQLVKEYGHPPAVECVPSQINQVFLNMVVNAGHAIGDQGRITVRSGHEGDQVWFEFEDDGCGMSAQTRQRIFEPFFTTKAVGKGTGLGLSLSYGIVQKHHGRIECDSEVGRGTRFRIWLPIHQPVALAA